ncbi:MAG: transposase [Lachnospiraceae bacterium]|nr:transposase [Lachnospiraceae bacterium]
MKDIKKHICPNCGGNLIVNVESQMYECPFCGVTFDYDYFREENVLDIAGQALMNNEVTSAGRAYDFMLEKEPDNFEALRGKALIAMDITKIDDICRLDLFSKLNYKTAYEEIDRAIVSSRPLDREYFTIMKDIVDAGHEYVDEKAQLETKKSERGKTLDALSDLVSERDTVFIYSSAKISPKKAVIYTILCYVICCLILFLGFKYSTKNPYSKAEDLSKYETQQTEDSKDRTEYFRSEYNYNDFNKFAEYYSNYTKYKEALEREEQRKINYDNWEKNNKTSYYDLAVILSVATGAFVLVVLMLFIGGRRLDVEISKIQAEVDEQTDEIKNRDKSMAALKDRIDHGYERLCELQTSCMH